MSLTGEHAGSTVRRLGSRCAYDVAHRRRAHVIKRITGDQRDRGLRRGVQHVHLAGFDHAGPADLVLLDPGEDMDRRSDREVRLESVVDVVDAKLLRSAAGAVSRSDPPVSTACEVVVSRSTT